MKADLTQEQVAARAGIGYKRYQKLESGKANLTIRTLVRLADAIGVDFWDLLCTPR